MREMCMSGSTSGMWKRGMAWIVRHRRTKEPATDRPNLNHRVTARLYLRREKSLIFSGYDSRPETGSLRPVATEAVAEVTKPLRSSVGRVALATWQAGRP